MVLAPQLHMFVLLKPQCTQAPGAYRRAVETQVAGPTLESLHFSQAPRRCYWSEWTAEEILDYLLANWLCSFFWQKEFSVWYNFFVVFLIKRGSKAPANGFQP